MAMMLTALALAIRVISFFLFLFYNSFFNQAAKISTRFQAVYGTNRKTDVFPDIADQNAVIDLFSPH